MLLISNNMTLQSEVSICKEDYLSKLLSKMSFKINLANTATV